MRISFSCKTNKDYVMVNTLKVQLNSGSVLTLDRHNTEYSISDPDNAGECLLDMEWRNCYLWAIDEENLWYDDKALIEEDCEKLFEGARLIELELEDDADEDYYVSIEALSIDGVSISIPDKLKAEDFPSYETFTNIDSALFTRDFYNAYCCDYVDACNDIAAFGEQKCGYFRTKSTSFYRTDGGHYCKFLEEFYAACPKFKAEYTLAENEDMLVKSVMERFPTKQLAELVHNALAKREGLVVKITEV